MRVFRRVALIVVLLLGIGLIVFPLADGLPKKTQGVDRVTNDFRSAFTPEALQRGNADLATVDALLAQLKTQVIPDQAAQKNVSPQELEAFLGAAYPAVGKGLTESPAIMARFHKLVDTMNAQASNFRDADSIPTASLPNTTVTYLYLVPGIILTVVGAAGLFFDLRGGGRRRWVGTTSLAVAAVLGAVMVGGTLATDQFGKTQGAERMFDAFRPVFTEQQYLQAHEDLATLGAMATSFQTQVLPDQAQAAGQPVLAYELGLATKYPAVGNGLLQTPRILAYYNKLVDNIGKDIGAFHDADSIPTAGTPVTVMPWLIVIPGALLIVVGVGGLLAGRAGGAPVAAGGTPEGAGDGAGTGGSDSVPDVDPDSEDTP